jgi:hypothetical protein
MRKLNVFYLLIIVATSIFMESCASISGLQDAKSVGENRTEITGALSLYKAPDFQDDALDSGSSEIPIPLFPIAEVSGRYGLSEKFDIGLKINSVLNTGIHAKYQFLGDRNSKIAMAVGGEFGLFGLTTSLINVQVPLFFSYHPSPKISLYANPRYVYQAETSLSLLGESASLNYLGGNAGLLFGTKHKFGIDIGYFGIGQGALGTDLSLFSIGLGGKFSFGGNDDDFGDDEDEPKKKKSKAKQKRKIKRK